jgi:hypothetical protein
MLSVGTVTLLLVGSACTDLDAPDQNAVSLNDLLNNPTPAGVTTAAQGLFRTIRDWYEFSNIVIPGTIGREGYDLDPSNQQFVNQFLVAQNPDAGSSYFLFHTNSLGQIILTAVDKVAAFTADQKEGVKGFTKTMQALELLFGIQGLDQSGTAIETSLDPLAPPPPIMPRDQVYARITQLLDEASAHLTAAGQSFAFEMTDGFAPFSAPADFLKFNRAIKARSDLYQASYNLNGVTYSTVLTDLAASFMDAAAPLSSGAYHTFSTNSGDALNQLNDPEGRQFFAHPSLKTDAKLRLDGSKDLRYTTKIREIPPVTRTGITTDGLFVVYNSPSSPVPIIKNEELILIRAEARWRTGDRVGALSDINLIRTNSGGLEPLAADPGDPGLRDELLYNRRYSLVWENGHRWLDMRRFGLLATLPRDRPGDVVYPYISLPIQECNLRSPTPPGCTIPSPL